MGYYGGLAAFCYHCLRQWIVISGYCLYSIVTAFTFITLPVEYDASHRALAWLKAKKT